MKTKITIKDILFYIALIIITLAYALVMDKWSREEEMELFPPANAANTDSDVLDIHVGIISFEEVVEICKQDNPPEWCPENLREPVSVIDFSAEQAEWLNEIEPASGEVLE